jgi:putative two-component system response regulator
VNKEISILIVDDEEPVRNILISLLGERYSCISAASAEEAGRIIGFSPFNLVITDIQMPGASGIDLCAQIQRTCPDTVTVVISGQTDIRFAIEAMRQGAFDFITKPFDIQSVLLAVERALKYQELVVAKRSYEYSLERTVEERTNELRALNDRLNQTLEILYTNYRATLRSLAEALEARDCETRGHSDRVVAYCLRLGRELGLDQVELFALEQGALLHDIGKIGVRDSILLKRGELTADEWAEMREHVGYGLRIIDSIDFLAGARPVVGQHHEKYDGTGYPGQLMGDQIHINARIFAIADALDAITSDRPYRSAASYSQARAEIVAGSDRHFDPEVVKAFLAVSKEEWQSIREMAGSRSYLGNVMDTREIRSFIISLKRQHSTAPLSTTVAQ